MLADKLRKSVLQSAIQGKLTEQLATDDKVEDLLQAIKEEKELLIKEKKIKKQKPLPEITEEEIPFEIPENWRWVRLGEISLLNIGLIFKPTEISNEGTIVLRSSNIKNGKIDLSDIVRINKEIPVSKLAKKMIY
jgi:type I restriction enzyme S subunit